MGPSMTRSRFVDALEPRQYNPVGVDVCRGV